MKFEIEIEGSTADFVEAFLKKIVFIKKVTLIGESEISNPRILNSIESYERENTNPTPLSLNELKEMINA